MGHGIGKLICALVLLAGCEGALYPGTEERTSENERPYPVEEVRGVHPATLPESCIGRLEGVEVSTEPVENGVAMVFSTTGDVAALRERVLNLGTLYDDAGDRPMMWEVMAPVDMAPSPDATVQDELPTATARRGVRTQQTEPLPDVEVAYEDQPTGARLLFVAAEEGDRERLATALAEHPQYISRGLCMIEHAAPPPQVLPDEDS